MGAAFRFAGDARDFTSCEIAARKNSLPRILRSANCLTPHQNTIARPREQLRARYEISQRIETLAYFFSSMPFFVGLS